MWPATNFQFVLWNTNVWIGLFVCFTSFPICVKALSQKKRHVGLYFSHSCFNKTASPVGLKCIKIAQEEGHTVREGCVSLACTALFPVFCISCTFRPFVRSPADEEGVHDSFNQLIAEQSHNRGLPEALELQQLQREFDEEARGTVFEEKLSSLSFPKRYIAELNVTEFDFPFLLQNEQYFCSLCNFLVIFYPQTMWPTCPVLGMSLGVWGRDKGTWSGRKMKDKQTPLYAKSGLQPHWRSCPPCPVAQLVSLAEGFEYLSSSKTTSPDVLNFIFNQRKRVKMSLPSQSGKRWRLLLT